MTDSGTSTTTTSPPDQRETMPDEGFDKRWLGMFIGADRWHFHRRLLQRYGIVLGPADYTRIVGSIIHGRAPLIDPKPGGTAAYLVKVPSTGALVFVAAKPNGEMVTALSVVAPSCHNGCDAGDRTVSMPRRFAARVQTVRWETGLSIRLM